MLEQSPLSKEINFLQESMTHRQNEHKEAPGLSAENALRDYAQAEAKEFLHESQVLPEHETERIVLNLAPESHDARIEMLFGIVLEKGIKNALDVVAKMNDPHLDDDFHRFLVQYLRTIKAIPGLSEPGSLAETLEHTLFSVTLPPTTDSDSTTLFKTFIQAMKQFYLGMAIDEKKPRYYTLELAVEHEGKDIVLYASVPNGVEDVFQKLVVAYYPNATVEEVSDDYNIFSPEGTAIVGSVLNMAQPYIFPMQTDDAYSHDPLAALVSSLSSLQAKGDGAAIQFLVSTKIDKSEYDLFSHIIDQAEKTGNTIKKEYELAHESVAKGVVKGLMSFFDSPAGEEKTEDKKIDTAGIELARKKIKSQMIECQFRIIATSHNFDTAKNTLATIKSSFNQFALVGGNSVTWNDIKTTNIHEFTHNFSYRVWNDANTILCNIDELATLFHFPVGLSAKNELKEVSATTAPVPNNMQSSGIVLGQNTYRGKTSDVFFAKEDRVRHCYVVGQTGTGKTVFLKNMILQDIKNGDGVCFIDPHGNDIQDILANIPPERVDDVIYFDPAYTDRPIGLNMLEYDVRYPEQKIFVINELLAIFNKLFDMKVAGGPMFEQYFRNAAGLVMEDPESGCTLLEIGRVLQSKEFRQMKLSKCKNPIIKQFWEGAEKTTGESALANFVPYITNKFDVFVSNDIMRPVIAQQKSAFNFRDIMDNKKILLVNLSKGRLGDINSHLIGLLLVGKITMAALSRVDIVGKSEVNDFYLYIDEFQNITTDSINTILSEARKYRLSLTVAHQYIEQLDEDIKNAVFGNVGSMVIHRVSTENAEVFAKQFSPTVSAEDIVKLQNLNCYIKMLVDGVPAKPFNSHTPFPSRGSTELAEKVKELSYLKYGRPREEVDGEIMARYQS